MSSHEAPGRGGRAAQRCGHTLAGAAIILLIAACGSEAENTDAPATTQTTATQTEQNPGKAATEGNETSAADTDTDGAAMTADAGNAADDGAQEAAAEKKKEEQKREPMDGYTVYNRFCATCHRTGLNAAPKHRNKKAWAPRIAKGRETLYKHSIEGFKGMPAKGGIAGLYDQEVKDAVDFMVEQAGGWDAGE